MRSDAKAPTAGSTQRHISRFAVPLLLIALFSLTLGASAAQAKGVVNFFGGEGVTGGKFGAANSGPGGIAINQAGTGGASAGDVYVVDRGNNRVQQFSPSGAFVRAFGFNVGGAGVHVCTVAASCVAGTASAEAGGLNVPQGIAIDQANGNLYVTDQTNRRVDVFSATGVFQGAFGWGVDTGAAAFQFCTTASTCQAPAAAGANAGQFGTAIGYPAVAPAGSPNAGHVYIADKANRRVDQLEPTLTGSEVTGMTFVKGFGWGVDTGAAEFQQCTTASVCQAPNTSSPTNNPGQFASNQPQALAVDNAGNVYAVESSGNNRSQKFDSAGNPLAFAPTQLQGSPGPNDIAYNPTTNRLFGLKGCDTILCAGAAVPAELRVYELQIGGPLAETHANNSGITAANGVAAASGGNIYLAANHSSTFRGVFILASPAVPPTASVEAPSPLTAHTATIKGKVNPKGFETAYRFEFSRDGGSSWEKLPATDQSLGNGEADVAVSQGVSNLIGGHSYRYKIVATKPFGAGTVTTSNQIFSAPASAPSIPATFATAVTSKTAVLGAEINPQNEATTYRFEYGSAPCSSNPCTGIPVPDGGIGSGEEPVAVAKEITGLTPGTTYHYRVVASNATGTTEGPDNTINTFPLFEPKADCPNQAFRYGAGANLPDCRAYEMVSPVDKGGDIYAPKIEYGRGQFMQASLDGGRLAYSSYRAFGDALGSPYISQYIANRGPEGWSTHSLNAPQGTTIFDPGYSGQEQAPFFLAFSPDLSSAWMFDFNKVPLTSDGLPGYVNLYRRDNLTDSYEALTNQGPYPPLPTEIFSHTQGPKGIRVFRGTSSDLSHQVVTIGGRLTLDAGAHKFPQVYDFHEGELHLVSVLPNGEPNPDGSAAGVLNEFRFNRSNNVDHAISDDGSRIFWTSGTTFVGIGVGQIYVRENPVEEQSALNGSGECTEPAKACTKLISPPGHNRFWSGSDDGSKVLYMGPNGAELLLSDVDAETTTEIAGEVEGVLGAADDLSRVYFTSKEVLDTGATAGASNIYLYEEGAIAFVATQGEGDTAGTSDDWGRIGSDQPWRRTSRVTPDGGHVTFMSTASSTGYDNTDAASGEADFEMFVFDAEADQLSCASCNPSGARPSGAPLPQVPWAEHADDGKGSWAAAWIQGWEWDLNELHPLSPDGNRLFFNSFDALVPRDTNGVQDVYQWQALGSGECTEGSPEFSELNDGCVSLISSGESSQLSEFVDASVDGSNVFFETSSSLYPEDPGLIDIYNARVDGGYQYIPPSEPCTGDACQSVPPAPNDPTPASASFRGAGDPVPAADCSGPAKRAAKLARQAKGLRAKAERSDTAGQAEALRERAARLSKRSKQLGRSAKRCRRASRRAAR